MVFEKEEKYSKIKNYWHQFVTWRHHVTRNDVFGNK